MERDRRLFLILFALISLQVHVIVLLVIYFMPAPVESKDQAKFDGITLEYQDNVATFVPDTGTVIDDPKAQDQKARYQSKRRNRTLDEMAAPFNKSGATLNNLLPRVKPQLQGLDRPKKSQLTPKVAFWGMTTSDDVPVSREGEEASRHLDINSKALPSQLGVSLPNEVQLGPFTVLNTDVHLFYSFYQRLADRFFYRWYSEVSVIIDYYSRRSPDTLKSRNYVTMIELVFDREGNFINSFVHQSSGLKDFDEAISRALKKARQIPNPPQEMLEEDGTIRILARLTVDLNGYGRQ